MAALTATVQQLLGELGRYQGPALTFMGVCGTHTMAICQHGIRTLLPDYIRLISGPGCPVCVTPVGYVDHAVALARRRRRVSEVGSAVARTRRCGRVTGSARRFVAVFALSILARGTANASRDVIVMLGESTTYGQDPVRQSPLNAERTDVTEEITRLGSHMGQFRAMVGGAGAEPVGRKLDFLIQEMGREVNTIASKALDAEISLQVVNIKAELEKIREQVQNIE